MTQLILYTSEDGKSQVQLRADLGTVWLTQLDMAELFNASKQSISLHLKNLFQDGELHEESVVKESLTTQTGRDLAASDHFRGVTKMLGRGSGSKHEVDHVSQFGPTSHQH
jgi:hypothetical protein